MKKKEFRGLNKGYAKTVLAKKLGMRWMLARQSSEDACSRWQTFRKDVTPTTNHLELYWHAVSLPFFFFFFHNARQFLFALCMGNSSMGRLGQWRRGRVHFHLDYMRV